MVAIAWIDLGCRSLPSYFALELDAVNDTFAEVDSPQEAPRVLDVKLLMYEKAPVYSLEV